MHRCGRSEVVMIFFGVDIPIMIYHDDDDELEFPLVFVVLNVLFLFILSLFRCMARFVVREWLIGVITPRLSPSTSVPQFWLVSGVMEHRNPKCRIRRRHPEPDTLQYLI